MTAKIAVPIERIENRILLVRGHKVLIDGDLAALYGVETRVLNQAVKRNAERFPADFMFQLSARELEARRSHFGEGSRFSVEEMAVAGDLGSHANEGGSPEQHRSHRGAVRSASSRKTRRSAPKRYTESESSAFLTARPSSVSPSSTRRRVKNSVSGSSCRSASAR
ncbi:MAG: ORF6N domain-containing protein [Betaproteobacteria bacterium]|nr:MAG: ORF6N domain-containing protein [Betaproteobacteria bacterium]